VDEHSYPQDQRNDRIARKRDFEHSMTSITGRLLKGSMSLSLLRAIVNGLATLSTFVLARNLAPSDFGIVALGMTILLIVSTVTELSLSEALIRHEEPQESHFSAA
jgi:lipopolysaccharide exporter